MNQKQRTNKRAKELGISYQQARSMYRPKKSQDQIQLEVAEMEWIEYDDFLLENMNRIVAESAECHDRVRRLATSTIIPQETTGDF